MTNWRSVTSGLTLLLLAACALSPKFETPQLDVVDVQVLRSDLLRQDLRVRLRVQNPNPRELPVKSITWQMEVAGEAFAHGESEQAFIVPAKGSAEFDVSMTANAAGTLLRLLSSGHKLDVVDYQLVGKVALSSGFLRSIPFTRQGQLKLR